MKILTGNEIVLNPAYDQLLKGQIIFENTVRNHHLVFKIKSTNPSLFEAQPSRGFLQPNKRITISVTTLTPINQEQAKQIARKHKFLIQYAITDKKIISNEDIGEYLRGPSLQNHKICINTNSIRGTRSNIGRSSELGSSQRFQFKSMVGKQNRRSKLVQQPSQALQRLKVQTQSLQRQRSSLLNNNQREKNGGGGMAKKIVMVVIAVIAGNMVSKFSGLSELNPFKGSSEEQYYEEAVQESGEGLFDIFNFGSGQQQQEGWFS